MTAKSAQIINKVPTIKRINSSSSALKKYQEMLVGSTNYSYLARYELIDMFIGPLPGALGMFLRKGLYPSLFQKIGRNVNFGRSISLRYPNKIVLGDAVAIDSFCLLDGTHGIHVGNRVLIGRNSIIQAKNGPISIGDDSVIASMTVLGSVGGIQLGNSVMISGQVYIGGGRYRTDDVTKPIKEQELYSNGPVVIGDDVWIGAGAVIMDGVKIGAGSVVGAGCLVQEDIPEYTVVVPHQRTVILPRSKA